MGQALSQSSNLQKYLSKHFMAKTIIGRFYSTVNELLSSITTSCVMNLGCGECLDILRLGPGLGSGGARYVCGLDINLQALKICKTMRPQSVLGLVKGDMMQLPLNVGKFDTLLCLEVLEHLSHPRVFLGEALKGFRGNCIFSVPNEPLYRLSRMILLGADIRRLGNHPEHKSNWTKRGFVNLLEKYVVIDDVRTPFPYTVVLCHRE